MTITDTGLPVRDFQVQPGENGLTLSQLGEVARTTRMLVEWVEDLTRRQIARDRKAGGSWEQIGEDLGMTPQQAISFYAEPALRLHEEIASRFSDLTEEEIMEMAVQTVNEVRSEQRRQREQERAVSAGSDWTLMCLSLP